jgi:hypothetical protein
MLSDQLVIFDLTYPILEKGLKISSMIWTSVVDANQLVIISGNSRKMSDLITHWISLMRYHVIDPEANGLRQTFCKGFAIRGSSAQRNSYSLIDCQQSREYAPNHSRDPMQIGWPNPSGTLSLSSGMFSRGVLWVSPDFSVLVCRSSKPRDRFFCRPFGYCHESQKSTTNPTFSFPSYRPEAVARNCRDDLRGWIIHYLVDNSPHARSWSEQYYLLRFFSFIFRCVSRSNSPKSHHRLSSYSRPSRIGLLRDQQIIPRGIPPPRCRIVDAMGQVYFASPFW